MGTSYEGTPAAVADLVGEPSCLSAQPHGNPSFSASSEGVCSLFGQPLDVTP